MSYLGVGVSPGNVPVYHGSNVKVIDRRVKVVELVLRCVICVLAILAAVLIGTDTQVREIFTIRKKAKFTDMKALVFLVIANGLAAAYSLVQVLRCVLSMIRGTVLFSKPLAWAIFSGDQVMAYLSLSAVAASAQSAVFAKLGQPELQWMKTCTLYEKFCNQVGEGVASAVLASLSMVFLSAISAFSLFRLYGDSKGKSSGGCHYMTAREYNVGKTMAAPRALQADPRKILAQRLLSLQSAVLAVGKEERLY
ncbi:CASP-like protein 2B1 [Sesamum angolense]|uniref:CASP-like protein n=1 Tax=Sesamum angolense TaxID=2727404 RepID=A0AAE2BV11_9LAMI|nr:CASP-like protein 2B1 [Sesamum angolense]